MSVTAGLDSDDHSLERPTAIESDPPSAAGARPARIIHQPFTIDLAIVAIAIAGIALRIWHLAGARSLWLDEGRIAINFVERPLLGLLQPLANWQSAAIGWLWLEDATLTLLGDVNVGLRLWPLIFGVAGLIVFLQLCRRELTGAAVLFATIAASLLPTYLYFSAEIKPYISDFFLTALLLLLGFRALERETVRTRELVELLVAGLVALLLSQPVALVLGGVGSTLFLRAVLHRRYREALLIGAVSAAWGALFLVLYLTVYGGQPELMAFMRTYWGDGFAPLPPRSAQDLFWFYRALIELPTAAFYHNRFITGSWGTANVMATLLLLLGAWRFGQRQPLKLTMMALPVLFALLASALRMWPFDGRLLLFAAPMALLISAAGLEQLLERNPMRRALAVLVPAMILIVPLGITFKEFVRLHRPPFNAPDLKAEMRDLAAGYRPRDAIYIMLNMDPSFRVHSREVGLEGVPVVAGRYSTFGLKALFAETEELRRSPRVWVVFATHFLSDQREMELDLVRFMLGRYGREVEHKTYDGGSLTLFEMDGPSPEGESPPQPAPSTGTP